MISLQTHLTLETVKSNEKLMGIKTEEKYKDPRDRCRNGSRIELINPKEHKQWIGCKSRWFDFYNAPTLADIIDNAEELFFESDIYGNNRLDMIEIIVAMCFTDKPLKEIEEYIISNIK